MNIDESPEIAESTATRDGSQGPFLFVDLYKFDVKGKPNWEVLVNTPRFYGGILKTTQGIKGFGNNGGWFNKNWALLKSVGADRYGST